MNLFLIFALVFALLSVAWSHEHTREFFSGRMPVGIERWMESWGPLILSGLVVPFLVLGMVRRPECPKCAENLKTRQNSNRDSTRAEHRGGADDREVPLETGATRASVTFRVVHRDETGKITALPGAIVRIGQDNGVGDENGEVHVLISAAPAPDTLVRVSDKLYLPRFLRFDDPIVVNRKDIELSLNVRVVVVDAEPRDTIAVPSQEKVTSSLENEFAHGGMEVLADDKLRDDIVHKLQQFSEGRALYDPKTLQHVGDFHGATHGAFWGLNREPGSFELECRLVNFKTAQVERTAEVQFTDEKLLSEAGSYVAEVLLSQLAQSKILSPKNESDCGRNVSLEGYALYVPSSWTLWVTIQPEGNAMHFPQFRVTPSDEYWSAADVYLGEEAQSALPARFSVYAVLTAERYTKKIDAYLSGKEGRGIDLNAWDRRFYRLLDHIRLTRTSTSSRGCTLP